MRLPPLPTPRRTVTRSPGAGSLAANPMVKNMPFDTLKDLQAVALLFRTPLALVVHPSVPAKSVSELIALLKQKPGEITFGHSGAGAAIFSSPNCSRA